MGRRFSPARPTSFSHLMQMKIPGRDQLSHAPDAGEEIEVYVNGHHLLQLDLAIAGKPPLGSPPGPLLKN